MPKKVTEAQVKIHLKMLIETPERIAACTAGMDETRLKMPPAPNEWSLVEILAHLRGCAEVWSYSIYAMLTLDKPELGHIHPRDWTKRLGYADLSFAENFQAFKVGRDHLVRILQGLTFEEWDRSCRFIGRANTFTVFGETMRMALHELDHCQQIEAMFSSE
ncbi:MAG: DinB family protein [Anaerolineae bacterium]|nr:DinB family protein [Anaerolineae bacterium]